MVINTKMKTKIEPIIPPSCDKISAILKQVKIIYYSWKPILNQTWISFKSPALSSLEAATGFKSFSRDIDLSTLSSNTIPIPMIDVFTTVSLSLIYLGAQLTKISLNVVSPIWERSVLKIYSVFGCPLKLRQSPSFLIYKSPVEFSDSGLLYISFVKMLIESSAALNVRLIYC